MGTAVVVIAMGEMGAGLAKEMAARGAELRTSLQGRGSGSAARAAEAGVKVFDDDRAMLDGADFMLSVVPPAAARQLAERLAPALGAAARKPIYVDCNAVSPAVAGEVAAIVGAAGCRFADGGILGLAPAPGRPPPRIYVSGPAAADVAALAEFGLTLRVIDDQVGKASALKCAYAALGKGVTAIGAEMILGAERAGIGEVLRAELAAYQPQLCAWLDRQLPDIYPKAHRWIAEMEEIGGFLDGTAGGRATFEGISRLFEQFAAAAATRGTADNEIDLVERFRLAMHRQMAPPK
jgi:3-hydroxyisobutyrate dehydrogenase-like beta-hydroxyacid dehydrogenase